MFACYEFTIAIYAVFKHNTYFLEPYRNVPLQRVGVLRRFGLKTGLDFAQVGLEPGIVLEETTGVYERIASIPNASPF